MHDIVANPRQCEQNTKYGIMFKVLQVPNKESLYQISTQNYRADKDDIYLYAVVDELLVYAKTLKKISNVQDTYWTMTNDEFGSGTVSFKNGKHYMRAHTPKELRTYGKFIELIHEDDLTGTEQLSMAWKMKCSSDDLGKLIPQPILTYETVQNLEPHSCSPSSLDITAPLLPAGSYQLAVTNSFGRALGNFKLKYSLEIDSFNPQGVSPSGGSLVTIIGSGFSSATEFSTCGLSHIFVRLVSSTEIVFRTISLPSTCCSTGKTCSLSVTSIDQATGQVITATTNSKQRRSNGFIISEAMIPQVNAVQPKMGGTAGGTSLTLSGSGFGSIVSEVEVTIHGSSCSVQSVNDSQIICETGAFDRNLDQTPIEPIVLVGGGAGYAKVRAQFWYIDRWSSPYTWGCTDETCKPVEGDIVLISKGQVLLLDETTPILKMLLIDGGKMLWARKGSVELHMEYGVVNNNGSFEIGSEDEPFCSGTALIKLHGHQRSMNLPIYGAKVFAVRFGTIDIHGCPITTTWSELDGTVKSGDTEIKITHEVENDWHIGDEIVVAATGDVTAWERSEKRKITAISGKQITLDRPLKYTHLGICQNGPNNNGLGWGWAGELCLRAEVGLLTRNVKLMGNFNHHEQVEAPRFEHETGSDQFGAVLFLHKVAHAKLAHFEVTHAGQAFNLARYPIHFHTTGSLPTSYVRGCAIHNTFNRALTLHGIHDVLIEYNVGYNVMGLMFFLEDAVEENNILRYNLGILNKKSAALLNVDVTPSVYWIPNPNNIFYGNRAVGSSHFGFWFNPPDEATGPSAKDPKYQNFCVKNRPLGGFYNNTAHSMGGYGFWVFKDLYPNQSGECGDNTIKAMKFGKVPEVDPVTSNPIENRDLVVGFFAWHCTRGAEITTGGAMHFTNFVVANNWISGLAWRESKIRNSIMPGNELQEDQASMYKRSIVIGHFGGAPELDACGDMGIETPWEKQGFAVHDISFYNFDEPTPELMSNPDIENLQGFGQVNLNPKVRRCVAIDPCYFTTPSDCGVTTYYSGVKWYNSQRRMSFAWEHEAAVWDIDGSFLRKGANKYLVPYSAHFDPEFCKSDTSGMYDLGPAPNGTMYCHGEQNGQKFKLIKFALNRMAPLSTIGQTVRMSSSHGETSSPFRNCRPLNKGYMFLLQNNQEYVMSVDGHEYLSNVTYRGVARDIEKYDWLVIKHEIPDKIDNARIDTNYNPDTDASGNAQEEINDIASHSHTPIKLDSWPTSNYLPYSYQVQDTKPYFVRYSLSGFYNDADEDGAIPWTAGTSYYFQPNFYKCFYPECKAPEPIPPTAPPTMTICDFSSCATDFTPGENYKVPSNKHILIDRSALIAHNFKLKFSTLYIDGTLEIKSEVLLAGETLRIEVDSILVNVGSDVTVNQSSTRKRRDASSFMAIPNGKFILGSEFSPINCDAKVIIKLPEYADSKEYSGLPDSITIGRKAIGGFGAIKMFGCQRTSFSFLDGTVESGDNTIILDSSIQINSWNIGDQLAIASTDWFHYHAEYVTIKLIDYNTKTIILDQSLSYRHLGKSSTSKQLLGREYHQGAEVALLTRNIVIDGNAGVDKMGGRVFVASYTQVIDTNTYIRAGSGQFVGVEFKDFGQNGHENYDDWRGGLLFYDTEGKANATEIRDKSFVKHCSFNKGYNGAIATINNANAIEILYNVIFNSWSNGIWTDSADTVIADNVIGHFHQRQVGDPDTPHGTTIANWVMANGIHFQDATNPIIFNNRVVGSDGSCYYGPGEECDNLEACSSQLATNNRIKNNVGHSCWRGVHVLHKGAKCQRYNGFTIFKCLHFGFYTHAVNVQSVILQNTIVADSRVGVSGQFVGNKNTADYRDLTKYSFTVKTSFIIGRDYGRTWDCDLDEGFRNNHLGWNLDRRQRPPVDDSCLIKSWPGSFPHCARSDEHIGMVFPEFLTTGSEFPAEPMWDTEGAPVLFARTCLHQVEFNSFSSTCSNSPDFAMSTWRGHDDHVFRIEMSDTSCTDCGAQKVRLHLPDDTKTNPGHCAGIHCDGKKSTLIVDRTGHYFGQAGKIKT